MKEIRLNILFIVIACSIPLILAIDELVDKLSINPNTAYCFQFRWVGPSINNKPEKYNCTGQKGVPCIEPLFLEYPNTTELWSQKNENTICSLSTGNVCLKHTVIFSNDVVNQSLFCGKVIEDQVSVITSGCYQEKKNGYTIEVCACQSRRGTEPCNASNSINYSNFILLIIFFVYTFKY